MRKGNKNYMDWKGKKQIVIIQRWYDYDIENPKGPMNTLLKLQLFQFYKLLLINNYTLLNLLPNWMVCAKSI